MSKQRGLGKGLLALISESNGEEGQISTSVSANDLPLEMLSPGTFQPRRVFAEEELRELSESIRKNGVLQPIIVRPWGDGEYQIVAGERRWRASKLAGKETIPVVIKDFDDREALEFALVENIQRQDLTPLEEAEGYQRLIKEFNYTQEQLSVALHKSRSHITNLLRLLTLPAEVKKYLEQGALTMGHARALVGVPNAVELAQHIIKEGLNVRQTEKLSQRKESQPINSNRRTSPKHYAAGVRNEDIVSLEQTLEEHLGMPVYIEAHTISAGKVMIEYRTLEELDQLMQKLSR